MTSIEWLQTNISAPVMGWVAPAVVILCFLIFFGYLIQNRFKFVALVYSFSVITGIIVAVTQKEVSDMASATISGIYAPSIYCFLFSLFGLLRQLPSLTFFGKNPVLLKLEASLGRGIWALVFGFLGGVIGFLAGSVISFVFTTIIAAYLLPTIVFSNIDPDNLFFEEILEFGIYFCGFLGLLIGVFAGWLEE